LKIAIVATFPNPKLENSPKGGYRRVTELINLFLKEKKYIISLYVISNKIFRINSYDYTNVNFISSNNKIINFIKTFFILLTKRKEFDYLILYNPTYLTLPAFCLKYFGVKVIIDYVDLQGTVVEGKAKILRKFIAQFMLKRVQYIITSSNFLRQSVINYNPTVKTLMYRGYFENFIKAERPLYNQKNIINIMYLGLLSAVSGVDILIKSFNDLNYKNSMLYIVGQGPKKKALEELVINLSNNSIKFKTLNDNELFPFIQNMDILTIPYIYDERNLANFPSKIIEFLYYGKAILATNVGEIPRVLDHLKTAYLVKSDSQDAFKNGLKELIEKKELRREIGNNAILYYQKYFSAQVVLNNIKNYFIEVESY